MLDCDDRRLDRSWDEIARRARSVGGQTVPDRVYPAQGQPRTPVRDISPRPSIGSRWRRFGGFETLHSYEVDVGPLMRGKNYGAAAEVRSAVPQAHLDFLASLQTALSVGRYFSQIGENRVPLVTNRSHPPHGNFTASATTHNLLAARSNLREPVTRRRTSTPQWLIGREMEGIISG